MSTNSDNQQSICKNCGQAFPDDSRMIRRAYCDGCLPRVMASTKEDEHHGAQAARREAFERMVPPLYRSTDKTRLRPILREAVERWKPDKMGVGFVGEAGSGKTRAATLMLRAASEEGRSVLWISGTRLARAAAECFSGNAPEREAAKKTVALASRVNVLLLDDLGKEKMTDRAEMQLYDLLEHRTSHELPTLWTSNSNAAGLHAMFSPERADAINRRLGKEFCEHIVMQ